MKTRIDETRELLERAYKLGFKTRYGDPLWESWLELVVYVEDDLIAMGGECPE
jgi:hypothetical protein